MEEQLEFDFIKKSAYEVDNYLLAEENQDVFLYFSGAMEENIGNIIFLMGSPKSGKTHLANIFKATFNAKFLTNLELSVNADLPVIERYDNYILDGLEEDFNEEALFCLLNAILQSNSRILITYTGDIRKKKIKMKDLKSRIDSAIFFSLGEKIPKSIKRPLLVKLFADRQMVLETKALDYLQKKLDNRYQVMFRAVDDLAKAASLEVRGLTIPFIKKVL